MAKYTVTAVKRDTLPKKDGTTWTKISVKTAETGDAILELGYGHQKATKDYMKAGDHITGYVENRSWTNGQGQTSVTPTLNGITEEYLYRLILAIDPNIESKMTGAPASAPAAQAPANSGWEGAPAAAPAPASTGWKATDPDEDRVMPGDIKF